MGAGQSLIFSLQTIDMNLDTPSFILDSFRLNYYIAAEKNRIISIQNLSQSINSLDRIAKVFQKLSENFLSISMSLWPGHQIFKMHFSIVNMYFFIKKNHEHLQYCMMESQKISTKIRSKIEAQLRIYLP